MNVRWREYLLRFKFMPYHFKVGALSPTQASLSAKRVILSVTICYMLYCLRVAVRIQEINYMEP